jgi:predicted ArsR family transcriptional regulator
MKEQTRQLVQLLADDVAARLIAALRSQSRTAPQLQQDTGASQKTVAHLLELLEAHGVVGWQPSESGTRGRPSRRWRLTADGELVAFERACDNFKALLLRRQLDDYEDDRGDSR